VAIYGLCYRDAIHKLNAAGGRTPCARERRCKDQHLAAACGIGRFQLGRHMPAKCRVHGLVEDVP
jgi:hypothetical protein